MPITPPESTGRHKRLDAFATFGCGRRIDRIFDVGVGLRLDQRPVVAGNDKLHLHAERLGVGVRQQRQTRNGVAGAGLGDDADTKRADVIPPVGAHRV